MYSRAGWCQRGGWAGDPGSCETVTGCRPGGTGRRGAAGARCYVYAAPPPSQTYDAS